MALTALQYIKKNISMEGETAMDFMKQWKACTNEDKDDLLAWAEEEMAAA